jgi:hypothetical protein
MAQKRRLQERRLQFMALFEKKPLTANRYDRNANNLRIHNIARQWVDLPTVEQYDKHRPKWLSDVLNMTFSNIEYLSATAKFLLSGLKTTSYLADDQKFVATFFEMLPLFLKYLQIIEGHKIVETKLKTVPVLSVALLTLQSSPAQASKFWHEVASGEGFLPHTPQWYAHIFIRDTSPFDFKKATNPNGEHSSLVYAKQVAYYWNMYYQNKMFLDKDYKPRKGLIVIENTVFSGTIGDKFAPTYCAETCVKQLYQQTKNNG